VGMLSLTAVLAVLAVSRAGVRPPPWLAAGVGQTGICSALASGVSTVQATRHSPCTWLGRMEVCAAAGRL